MIKITILSILILVCSNTALDAAILEKTNDTLFFDTESIPIKMYSNHKDGYLHFICEDEEGNKSWWKYNPNENGEQPKHIKEFEKVTLNVPGHSFFFIENNQPRLGINFGPFYNSNDDQDSSVFKVYDLSSQEYVREESQDRTTYLSHYETKDKIVQFKYERGRALTVIDKEKDSTIFYQEFYRRGEHLFFDYNNDGIDELAVWEYYDSIQVFSFTEKNVEKIITINIPGLVTHWGNYIDFSSNENSLNIYKDRDTLYKININSDRSYYFDTLNLNNSGNMLIRSVRDVAHIENNRSIIVNWFNFFVVSPNSIIESHLNERGVLGSFINDDKLYLMIHQEHDSKGYPDRIALIVYNIVDEPIVDHRLVNQTYGFFITEDMFYFRDNYFTLHNQMIEENREDNKVFSTYIKEWQARDFILKYKFNKGITDEVEIRNNNIVRKGLQELLFPFRGEVNSDGRIAIPGTYYYYWYDFTDNFVNDTTNFNELWRVKYLSGILSCGYSENDYYSIGIKDTFNNVIYLNLQKEDELDTLIQTNSIISNTKFYDFNETEYSGYALAEGLENDINSQFYNFRIVGSEIESFNVIELDGTASGQDLNTNNTKIAIVLNEKNAIIIINLANSQIEKTIDLKPLFSGKPKDVAFDNGMLYVTTNNNQVLIINETSGELEDRILVDGSSKDIIKNGNILAVVNDKHPDGTLSNRILFFDLLKTSVDQDFGKITTPPIRIYPHPVANDFHLVSDELVGELSIAIIDGQGKIVATHTAVADGEVAMSADELGLRAGNYTAIINGTKAVRFIVIK